MKKFGIILSLFFLASCGQDYNSNANDASVYEDSGITPGTNFYNAYEVMKSKCFSCHGVIDNWKNYKTSQDWIDHGWIVSGSLTNSRIYTSLSQNGGDMPKSPSSPLTRQEVETIKTWINAP